MSVDRCVHYRVTRNINILVTAHLTSSLVYGHNLSIEDDLWDLPVLHAGPVVVTSSVAELECDLASVVTIHRHFPQSLRAVVTVQPLERAHCGVVGVWLDLQRLLEHCPEC